MKHTTSTPTSLGSEVMYRGRFAKEHTIRGVIEVIGGDCLYGVRLVNGGFRWARSSQLRPLTTAHYRNMNRIVAKLEASTWVAFLHAFSDPEATTCVLHHKIFRDLFEAGLVRFDHEQPTDQYFLTKGVLTTSGMVALGRPVRGEDDTNKETEE